MSLCDGRGLFATDKEMAQKRSRSYVEGHWTQSVTKSTGQRADELISVSLSQFRNKHGIAERKETVLLFHCFRIGLQHQFPGR